jgi:hypothetical protein
MQSPINPSNQYRAPKVITYGIKEKHHFQGRKIFGIVFVLMFFAAVVSGIYYWQTTSNLPAVINLPSHKDPTQNWKTYSNSDYGFSFTYPQTYVSTPINFMSLKGQTVLLNLTYTEAHANFRLIAEDKFNLSDIQKRFAPTGVTKAPASMTFGQNIFYYYGPGGGGVSYPDQYFFNLNGKLLIFIFDGPYDNDKTPSPAAKQTEGQILATLQVASTASDTTSTDLPVYTDSRYGFEFSYASNLMYRHTTGPNGDMDIQEFYDPVTNATQFSFYINALGLDLSGGCRPTTSLRNISGIVMNKDVYCDGQISYKFSGNSADLIFLDPNTLTDKEFENLMKTFKWTR